MAYNTQIEDRISEVLKNIPGIVSKKMFGGIAYMMNGNMLAGVHKEYLILRLNEKGYQEVMGLPFAKPFDITGRSMKGWAMVEGSELLHEDYSYWIKKARDFVETLPEK